MEKILQSTTIEMPAKHSGEVNLDDEYNQLRKHFLEASRNNDPLTQTTRDREEISKAQKEAQQAIIDFGLQHPRVYNEIAHGVSYESFQESLRAASNRFSALLQREGDYYIPENGQTVYMVDGESDETQYVFSISNSKYDVEEQKTTTQFTIRELSEAQKDVVHLGAIEFSDLDLWPTVIISPYSIDVFSPDDLQRQNGDRAMLLELKALRGFTGLINIPKITKTAYSGKRIDAQNESQENVTELKSERVRTLMTRRRTFGEKHADDYITHELHELVESLSDEEKEAILDKYPGTEISYTFFIQERNLSPDSNESETIVRPADVEPQPVSERAEALAEVKNLLVLYPEGKVIVGIKGLYVPPEWEDHEHQKKHTRPHVRRIRRKNGKTNPSIIIDDRSSPEWLGIKAKMHQGTPLNEAEKAMVNALYAKHSNGGIHYTDGTFSPSEHPEGKSYSMDL